MGIWATNVPDWLTFLYATAKIGAVLVTVNTNYKQNELEYLCKDSDMQTLCITDGTWDCNYVDMTYTMLPELKTCERGHLNSKRFPYLKNVVYIGMEKYRGMFNTAELLLLGQNVEDETLNEMKAQVSCHDVCNMQYTSGTTGFPKGVMLTHYGIANDGYFTGENMGFTADDKLCVCVPLFHCFGVVLATMNCLTHGCTEVMVEKFDPLVVLASIHKERCTAVYGVPTMFIAELNHPMFSMFDLTCLRTGIMAGSLCPVELMKQVSEKMYMTITSVYGLTESSPGMTQTCLNDITGRIKDMIIRGGENIYPREIEEFLYHMPGIRDVQVAAVPSKKYGEAVGAFIILEEGVKMTPEDVQLFCRGKIARYKIPKYVFFIDQFPLTGSGKIQKFKLKEMSLKLCEELGIVVE